MEDFQETFNSTFEITEVKYDKTEIEQCPAAKAGVLPTHPFRMYVVGASGSGKTNLILNLLSRVEMYKDYFKENIIVISPTARQLDDSYAVLELPQSNFFPCSVEVLERIFELAKLAKEQKKMKPTLLILDDILSYKKFCNSKELLKLMVMGRHYGLSTMVLSQAYHRIQKSVRLNFSCVIYFKGSNRELEVLADDFTPPGMSKRQFMRLVSEITDPQYSFLFIDLNRSIDNGRYRQNLVRKVV